MPIDKNLTLEEAMRQLKNTIAESQRQTAESQSQLKALEALTGITSSNNFYTAPRRALRVNGEVLTLAQRAEKILAEKGEPMAQTAIRDVLRSGGFEGTEKATFLSALYTAMTRKTDIFKRNEDNLWYLVKWHNAE